MYRWKDCETYTHIFLSHMEINHTPLIADFWYWKLRRVGRLFAAGKPQECCNLGLLKKSRHWSHFSNIQTCNSKVWAFSLFRNFIKIKKYIWPWQFPKTAKMVQLKVLGIKECRRVECKSAKSWSEMVKELSDGVTETQILQILWKK